MSHDNVPVLIELAHEADFSLGCLVVRPSLRQVVHGASVKSLEPRVMQVLVALAHRRGEVLSRDDLGARCWDGKFVSDSALTRCISKLRQLGNESGEFFIEAIARVGYRLVPSDEPEAAGTTEDKVQVDGSATGYLAGSSSRQEKNTLFVRGFAAALVVAATLLVLPTTTFSRVEATSRIAFFGFSSSSNDARASAIAQMATDEMFETIGSIRLDTVARQQTLSIPEDQHPARAKAVRARYILSGTVRTAGDRATVSIYFTDAASLTTLLEHSVSGSASELQSIAFQTAHETSSVMRCILGMRANLEHETPELLNVVAALCRGGGWDDDDDWMLIQARKLVEAQPNSALFQAQLAGIAADSVSRSADWQKPARLSEAEVALARARSLDASSDFVALADLTLKVAGDSSLAEQVNDARKALAQMEGRDPFAFSQVNLIYARILMDVGRWRDAYPHLEAVSTYDPLQGHTLAAIDLAMQGESTKANAAFQQAVVENADAWKHWIHAAIFLGTGDPNQLLNSAPSVIQASTVACWRAVNGAWAGGDASVRFQAADMVLNCSRSGDFDDFHIVAILAALGDLDGAFEVAEAPGFRDHRAILLPSSRSMREDPRFLTLVKKLGVFDYWETSGQWPDFCQTETTESCQVLAASARSRLNME